MPFGELQFENPSMSSPDKPIDKIENCLLETGKKLDLALLLLDRKKIAYLGNHKIFENDKERQKFIKEFSQELEDIKKTCEGLGFLYNTKGLRVEDEAIVGFNISIGKNGEDLTKFADAEKKRDDKTMGLMLGYPWTAVEAYNSKKSLDFEVFLKTELSEKERKQLEEEGVIKFLSFQPSKEHWREELNQAREDQGLIKEKTPRLYEEIMKSELGRRIYRNTAGR